jgi:thiol-disulfide isomerase/thioredoxin
MGAKTVLTNWFSALLAFSVLLGGCYGRPKMHSSSSELAIAAGVQAGKPSVIVFSALWCHPCREEIDALNQASRDFAGIVQFRGFLVEGEEKGSMVKPSDLSQFTSFTGQAAQYGLLLDPNWQVFDKVGVSQGHALPTMVILNSSLEIDQVIQQSLDYDTQLRPLLLALARGQKTSPGSTKPGPGNLTDTVGNWSARAEVVASPDLLNNLTVGWQAGLKKYAFTSDEMPLDAGQISFNWDGAAVNTPRSASWISDTDKSYCTLDLSLNPDATVASMSGNCRTK